MGGPEFLVPRDTSSFGVDQDGHSRAMVVHDSKHAQPHPSTSRALVLRKAAYAIGELAAGQKISGQEKLSLLAEEMMIGAIRVPFRMSELSRMAESQLGVHLDEISNLKDPDSFYDDILATIDARPESVPDSSGKRRPPLDDPRWVALVVGCRIHNVYLLAGSWRIVRNLLRELGAMGLNDLNVRSQLRTSENMRAKYLILYDIVTMLARMGQQRVANIAAATTHYAPYFVRRNRVGHDGEMEFDYHGKNPRKLREAHKSFIDALILELVLPDSPYPPYVLMALLHNAVEECRKEEKRFSQALWDAVGDFSVTVQVLDFLQGPLWGIEGEPWVQDKGLSQEFAEFLRVQALSDKACQNVELWQNGLEPLINTKRRQVLTQLWYNVNKSCQQVSKVGIDHLWSLQNDLRRSPQWSTYVIPGLNADDDSDLGKRALSLHKRAKLKQTRHSGESHPQIEDVSDDDEIPPLLTDSDSSDQTHGSSDEERSSEGDSESDFNPDDDERLQELLQEALDTAIDADLLELPEFSSITEGQKSSNPFTRMLANLKDRYFPANPTLRASESSRSPFRARPGTPPLLSATQPSVQRSATKMRTQSEWVGDPDFSPLEPPIRPSQSKPKSGQLQSSAGNTRTNEAKLSPHMPLGTSDPIGHNITVGDVEDEGNNNSQGKKTKKKKKTKKRAQNYTAWPQPTSTVQHRIATSPNPSVLSNASEQSPVKQSPRQSSIRSSIESFDATSSRASLPLIHETTAQSARAYIQSENLTSKIKIKTRPAFAGSFFRPNKETNTVADDGTEKKGFLGRTGLIHLPKRASNLMNRLINSPDGKTHAKKPMKWEEFLQVMRAMGFSYNPSTAGSSVRFDPPDPKDPPITFHKPHPDPTLQRNHLREFGKRLRKSYGWSPEQFSKFGMGEDGDNDDRFSSIAPIS